MHAPLAAVAASLLLLALAAAATSSLAQAAPAPRWHIEVRPAPRNLPPGAKAQVLVTATNMGDQATSGPITVTDTLPKGLKELSVRASPSMQRKEELTCPVAGQTISCPTKARLAPYEAVDVVITVSVEGTPGELLDQATVEGGGAAAESTDQPVEISGEPAKFGIERFELTPEEEDGSRDARAGSHPFQLTTTLDLNQSLEQKEGGFLYPSSVQLLKDVNTELPAGLIGDANPEAIPQCSDHDFSTIESDGRSNACPANTAVGVAVATINEPQSEHYATLSVPVFSLAPAPGEPARFGFEVLQVPVILDTSLASGGDYSVTTSVRNASQVSQVLGTTISLWGEPGDPRHDNSRGWDCLAEGRTFGTPRPCTAPEPRSTTPFLSLPTACSHRPLSASSSVDSWPDPTPLAPIVAQLVPELEGCEALPFNPEIKVEPETHAASTPSGFTVDVHVPQGPTLEPGGLSEAAVRETTVDLPPGVLLNPAAANGLEGCTKEQIGYSEPPVEFEPRIPTLTFTSSLPEPLEPGVNFCPNASKVGLVHVKTPDLANELEGGVYLAMQNANPFGSLFAMYIVAEDPATKTLVKLAGEVRTDATTGQIATVFRDTPQLPFEDLKLQLFGGSGATLSTPATCGSYTTTSSFVPWSGTAPRTPSSTFSITSGAEGTGCARPLPLAPSFSAATTNNQAGAFSDFELTLGHPDADQAPTSLSMHLPAGIAAILKSVALCPEPQASQGTCGPQSEIGEATASAGLGGAPFTETGGRVYITGPYRGAPFGLTVVIPTAAGPFNFGNVVTRSALRVDPNTAAVTIESELPTMVNTALYSTGVPVQLKQIHVVVNRPNFEFNATNCTKMQIQATVTGNESAAANVTAPYQAANCQRLPFHPGLIAKTNSHFTKKDGTSLVVTVTSSPGQTNIAKTKIIFPEQLPTRLTTLQNACLGKTFNANPASCPEGSVIGRAVAHTPVLAKPLEGPAYLVSHGNAAFPDAEFVLQGEGITLVLDGQTNIHKGVTSSTFNSVPDAPVSTFVVTLPAGPHSAFTGLGNLCHATKTVTKKVRATKRVGHRVTHKTKTVTQTVSEKLVLPTTLTGQNGDVIERKTPLAVAGCKKVTSAKNKPAKKASNKKKKKK